MTRIVTVRRTFVMPRGLYARIAKQLKIDPSFVSRVAHGHRKHERISKALEVELRKVLAAAQKSIRKSPKR
jgi:hypothetical protein